MSTRTELQIFSTSFIDMICVALCSQIILWIIASDEEPVQPREKRSRFVQITQFGVGHLCQTRMSPSEYATESVATIRNEDGHTQTADLRSNKPLPGSNVQYLWTDGVDDVFAESIRLTAPQDCTPVEIEFPVATCVEPGVMHYIRCESSLLGAKPEVSFFLCEGLPTSHKQPPALGSPQLEYFAKNVTAISPNKVLRIAIPRHGVVKISCAPEDEDVSTTEAIRKIAAEGVQTNSL